VQTVRDIQRQATDELQRRIFQNGIFRRQRMKDVAMTLAREHTAGMSPENLLTLARHDTWLKTRTSRSLHPEYPGEKTERIEDKLHSYIRSELRVLVDSFFEGRTSVELAVQSSTTELIGFFNGERPGRKVDAEGLHDDAYKRHHAPYV
jgi:hypothetical protein